MFQHTEAVPTGHEIEQRSAAPCLLFVAVHEVAGGEVGETPPVEYPHVQLGGLDVELSVQCAAFPVWHATEQPPTTVLPENCVAEQLPPVESAADRTVEKKTTILKARSDILGMVCFLLKIRCRVLN